MSRVVTTAWGLALILAVPCSAAEPTSPAASLRGTWKLDKQAVIDTATASAPFKALSAEDQGKAREALAKDAAALPDSPFLEVTDKTMTVIQSDGERFVADYEVKSVKASTVTVAKTFKGETTDAEMRVPDDRHLVLVGFLPDGGDMPLVRVEAGPRKK